MEKSTSEKIDNKSPLDMLVKACQTIGCGTEFNQNNVSNSNIKKSMKNGNFKQNGYSNGTNNRHSPNNGQNLLFDHSNGKLENGSNTKNLKKDSINRKSPRTNNLTFLCEPSTSSPSNLQNNNLVSNNASVNNFISFPNNFMRGFNPQITNSASILPSTIPPNFSMTIPNSAPLQLMAAMAAAYNSVSSQSNFATPVSAAAAITMMQMQPQAQTQQRQQQKQQSTTTTTPAVTAPISATQPLVSTPSTQIPPSTINSQKKNIVAVPNTNSNINSFMTMNSALSGMDEITQQQIALMTAQYGLQFGNPFMLNSNFDSNALSAAVVPTNGTNVSTAVSSTQLNSTASVEATLMALACGQARHVCSYDVKGTLCGKNFESDADLMAHLKTHISQNISGSTTPKDSVLKNEQNISGGGKIKSVVGKQHQQSQQNSPKQQIGTPVPAHLPQQQTMVNGNGTSRFHPYSNKSVSQQQHAVAAAVQQQQQLLVAMQQQQQQQQQMQFAAAQYELMAAAAASGAIPATAMGIPPFGSLLPQFMGAMPMALQNQQIMAQHQQAVINEK